MVPVLPLVDPPPLVVPGFAVVQPTSARLETAVTAMAVMTRRRVENTRCAVNFENSHASFCRRPWRGCITTLCSAEATASPREHASVLRKRLHCAIHVRDGTRNDDP